MHYQRCTKQPFLLLEVLVGCFLLLICAAPAIRLYTNIYLAELESVRLSEQTHLVHLLYADFVERLYKQQISWDELMDKEEKPLPSSFPLENEFKRHFYGCTYHFNLIDSNKENEKFGYLFNLELKISDLRKQTEPLTYTYALYIDRGMKNA